MEKHRRNPLVFIQMNCKGMKTRGSDDYGEVTNILCAVFPATPISYLSMLTLIDF
jgi:hypothetical protein